MRVIVRDERGYIGDLEVIVAHYSAIKILIDSAKRNNDVEALNKWDDCRLMTIKGIKLEVYEGGYK